MAEAAETLGRQALSDPGTAAPKLIEIANGVEAVQHGRIHIEKINGRSSSRSKAPRSSTRLACSTRLRRDGS
jgi:hypothetical protein